VIRALVAIGLASALAGCVTTPVEPPTLDNLARQYLTVQLAIGEQDPGYVDAYYGPAEFAEQAAAEKDRTSLPLLQARVIALDATLSALPVAPGTEDAARVRYLRAMLGAAKVRLRMLRGETIPFADEAEGLFGVRPELIDLATLDPVLERIEQLVPGEGPLNERIEKLRDQFVVPNDRLKAVMDAAVAECRNRTLPHIPLPDGESFSLSLVSDKPWGGYNYYQGNYNSVIEINTDSPTRLDRVVDVGCHEAYPGHHVYSTLIERDLVRGKGDIEYTLLPLFSPSAMIAEGSAEYGRKLAFPGNSQFEYERDVLAPLAGIDASGLGAYYELRKAFEDLSDATYTIGAGYLDGTLSREQAIELSMKYRLTDRSRAEQSLRFFDTYRSYIINYGLGRKLVGDTVERAGEDEDARWARFIAILNAQTLPEDLR